EGVPDREHDPVAETVIIAVPLCPPGDQADLFQPAQLDALGPRPPHQPVAGQRGVAQAEAPHRLAQEAALAEVVARLLAEVVVEKAALEQLGRPANRLKHKSAPLRLRGRALVFQRDSRPAGEKFESLGKGDALVFLNKADDVAVFVTGPTLVALAPG